MENEEIYYQIKKLYEENEYDKIIKLVLSLEYECLDDDILDIFYNALDIELSEMHNHEKHHDIVKLILSIASSDERFLNDNIKGLLAVAYNNTGKFDLAIETLNSLSEYTKNHHTWFYKISYAYLGKCEADTSLEYIDKAINTLERNKDSIRIEEYNYYNVSNGSFVYPSFN